MHHAPSRTRAAAAVLAAAALALSACSSTGGRKAAEASAAAGSGCQGPKKTVALITHSAKGDAFWDLVRKGADDAGLKDCITVEYSSDPDGARQAQLVDAAVDKKVDGIVVSLSKPDQMKGSVEKAVKAGIPVTALNGGVDAWKAMGVLGFFGQEDKVAGEETGKRLASMGAKKVLCVLHEQGNVGNDSRCAGIKETFPNTVNIYVKGEDTASTQSTLTGKLQEDKDIDQVIGLRAATAMVALQSVKESGSKAKVATFDTDKDVVAAIKSGQIEFAVDQQPYLQGYLGVDALWLYLTNGDTIGGGQATLTGPAFVTSENVDAIAKYAQAGKR